MKVDTIDLLFCGGFRHKNPSLSYHKGHRWRVMGLWPSHPLPHFFVLPKEFFIRRWSWHLMLQLLESQTKMPLGCVWTWAMRKYASRIAIVTGKKWWSTNGFSKLWDISGLTVCSGFYDPRETPGTVRSATEGLQGEGGDWFWGFVPGVLPLAMMKSKKSSIRSICFVSMMQKWNTLTSLGDSDYASGCIWTVCFFGDH